MKLKYFFKISLLLFLIIFSFSCGGGGGDIVDSLIPDLSAAWINTTDNDDKYFFLPPNAGVASSTFDGNENLHGELHSFSGSFQNSKISFKFNDGPKNGMTYTGKINGNSTNATMTLTTPSGTITLQRTP